MLRTLPYLTEIQNATHEKSAFVGRDTPAILKQVQELPVLTIGESASFLTEGGAVRVFVEDNRIRFKVGGGAAEKKGLRISSQLLTLAARRWA